MKMTVYNSLSNWISPVLSGKDRWEANNIHIDEIFSYKKISRNKWIEVSLSCFDIIIKNIEITKPYLVFLHFDLSNSKKKEVHKIVSYEFLQSSISEFTPPSFNCTTEEYFSEFYEKELLLCSVDSLVLNRISSVHCGTIKGYFRTSFEESENEYSRELYMFYFGKTR
jgi:hypothetical protein